MLLIVLKTLIDHYKLLTLLVNKKKSIVVNSVCINI